ncbi:hypothetical protein [Pseudomonas tolaasii]|uniref:hypothetical protein n=1 Tax=Pseudomonas tolaasii TaxID=29442 RepID=UPI001C52DE12|nr:hypothetical protein [Pseudomonas tolaasii]MBW4792933.1 hypothetical protein [Pseudomonas tolaasii]QXQ21457.1 hypothetical protein I7845_13920 [Pseudomonas tolaasii]
MTPKIENPPSKKAVDATKNTASTTAWQKEVSRASSVPPKTSLSDELGKEQKRPEGDERSAKQIIEDTPLLRYLGNQSNVKDNLKKQVGDFDTDADAAYRASKVLEHIVYVDENGKLIDSEDTGNTSIDGFTKDDEARHGTEAGRLQDFGKYGYSSLKGKIVVSDLGENQRRPEGDTRSAREIIDDTPLLRYLGNQSHVRDNLKAQVGDFDNDADAAYRATQVLEHVVSLDEEGKMLTGPAAKNKYNNSIDGFTKDNEARHFTEAGRLQDFGKYGYSSLKGDLIQVVPKTYSDKAPPPDEPQDVIELREKYHIPSFGAEGLMDMELTNDKTVGGQTAENFVQSIKDDIKSGKLSEDSDEAKLIKLMDAQAALDDGYELYGYAESINLGSGTYRETDKDPTKLSGKDVKEMVDEDKLAKKISDLMGKEEIKDRYSKELQNSVSGLSEERLNEVREQIFPALFKEGSRDANLDFEDYVIAMNDSGDPKKSEMAELDVDRYFESLRILEPDSYTARRQTFDQNMMTHQLNSYMENPEKVSAENTESGLRSTFSILKSGINATLGSLDKGDKSYDLYKKMKDEVDILDGHIKGLTPGENSKIAAAIRLATISGDPKAIDKIVDTQLKGLGGKREETAGTLKKVLHTASSTGSLGALSGTMSLVSSALQLANGGGWKNMSEDQKIAAVRDLVGGLSWTNDFLKFGSNIVETLGGKHSYDPAVDVNGKRQPKINATQWLGLLDENFPDIWGKEKAAKSDALASAISTRVQKSSDTLKNLDAANLSADDLKDYDKTIKSLGEAMGVKDIPGANLVGRGPSYTAISAGRSFMRFMGGSGLDLTGGVMDIVSGARKLKKAKTALEKVDAAFSLGGGISGTGMAISNTIAMFAPKGAHLAGILAGDVASSVVRGLAIGSRVLGPIFSVASLIFGVAGTLIAEAVQHAKLQKLTDSQGQFFKDLASAGVTRDDWGDKLEYARYATYMYGGRDTPDDKSIFEFQSDEWKHFQQTEDKKGSSLIRLAPYLHKDGDPNSKNHWEEFLSGSTSISTQHGLNRTTDDWRPWGSTDMDAGKPDTI